MGAVLPRDMRRILRKCVRAFVDFSTVSSYSEPGVGTISPRVSEMICLSIACIS